MPWSGCGASARPTGITTSRWCAADLGEAARFARIDTPQFRLLKACTPGPFTFLLPATRETPAPPAA